MRTPWNRVCLNCRKPLKWNQRRHGYPHKWYKWGNWRCNNVVGYLKWKHDVHRYKDTERESWGLLDPIFYDLWDIKKEEELSGV